MTTKSLTRALLGCAALFAALAPNTQAAAQDAARKVVIGLSQPNLEHPYRVGGTARAKEWAKAHPNVELVVIDGRRDSAVQLASIEDLMSRRVDVLVMSPNDSNALGPVADAVKRAKVPLIVFDRKLNTQGDAVAAFIGADNVEMGRVAARFLADKIGGKGTVIQVEGTPGASATIERKQGFEQEMAKHPGVKVVSYVGHYRMHDAATVMEDAIVAHRDVAAVYAHNDSMALGAAQVLGERGKSSVPVVGMDGAKEGCDGIKAGTLAGSVYYPTMFPEALDVAMNVLDGKAVEKSVMLDTPIITTANAAQFCN